MIKKITSVLLLLIFIISCNGQEKGTISDKDLNALLEQERKNEERAKNGSQTSVVNVITNASEVKQLKQYILEKNKEKQTKELAKLKNKTLAERYKSGDKSVVPLLVKTLNGDDENERNDIYRNLRRVYSDSETYNITEDDLIKAILSNISIEADEKAVIQLAGFMDLPGYSDVFENHLFNNKPKDVNRLLYWLGKKGKSKKTLDYMEGLILKKNFDFEANDYVMSGLKGFAEHGDTESKQKVFDIALEIYNRKLIPKARFEEMETTWSSTNPAITLTQLLLESNEERVVPIANAFLEDKLSEQKALLALINIEGEKHKPLVFQFLKDEDKFFDGLYPAEKMYQLTKDNALVNTILLEFENRKEHPNYAVDRITSRLVAMEADYVFDDLDTIIKNKNLITALKRSYELTKGSIETIAQDLYDMKVVDQPFSKRIIEKAQEEAENDDGDMGYVYNLLNVSGIYQWFDAETGFVPVDYDNLILQFSKNSNDKITAIDVWMDAEADSQYNVNYKIYVSANQNIYTISPEDIGDWYDVDLVLKLMNTIAADANLTERFISLNTGDQTVQVIFGPQEHVEQFVEKYKL